MGADTAITAVNDAMRDADLEACRTTLCRHHAASTRWLDTRPTPLS